MSQSIDLLRDSTLQKTNALLAVIAKNSGGNPASPTADEIRTIIRGGAAKSYFEVGDQISCYKATAGSGATSISGGSVALTYLTFVAKMRSAAPGPYEFVYDGSNWKYDGKVVTLSEYGITLTGTAADGDTITITLTATELDWDVVDFDQKVWKAWKNASATYFTVIDAPGANELVFTRNGQTFAYAGYVSTAYNSATKQISVTLTAGTVLVCDRVADSDTVDGTHNHSLELLLHDGYANIQFDAAEAVWANTNETTLAAGNYYFTLNGVSYQFTLANDVPAGGQIVPTWNSDHTAITAVTTYSGPTSTTAIDSSVSVTTGTTGTELTGLSHHQRTHYGNSCYKTSGIRQWLNSNAAGGSWWASQHKYDRPSASAATDGFLRGVDPDFIDLIGEANYIVNLNNMTANGDTTNYVDADDSGVTAVATRIGVNVLRDKFSLASFTEDYMGKLTVKVAGTDKSASIGAPLKYFSRLAVSATTSALAGRKKYKAGSACYWWGRCAYPGIANYVYIVDASGAIGSYLAGSTGYAAVPACSAI